MNVFLRLLPILVPLVVLFGCNSSSDDPPAPQPPVAPSGLSYSLNPASYPEDIAITANMPTVSGAPTMYAVAPALPTGLMLDAGTGAISGTPTAPTAAALYTITASNSAGSTMTAITLEVTALAAPSALSYADAMPTYTVGVAVAGNMPTVTGTVTTWASAPPLPAGLQLNQSTGAIEGTPTAPAAATAHTITASNPTGSTTAMVTITVDALVAPSGLSYTTPVTYTRLAEITPNTPTVTGAVTTYAVAPALPGGLAIDPVTGILTGTPATNTAATDFTVTATNPAGSTMATVNITVQEIPAPTGFSYTTPVTYTESIPIAPSAPTITGDEITYTAPGGLPAGLALDMMTGVLSGTPTTPAVAADFMITATNAGGSAMATVNITIDTLVAPAGLSYSTPMAVYDRLIRITENKPTVTGIVTAYSVAPALPAGLVLNATTGVISGIPAATMAPAVYTVTASNPAGSNDAMVDITVEAFTISPVVFVTNERDDTVSRYQIDLSAAGVAPVGVSRLADGADSTSALVTPDSSFLYVAQTGLGSIAGYAVDAQTAALTSLGMPVASNMAPTVLDLNSTASVLYASSPTGNSIAWHTIGADGTLAAVASVTTGFNGPTGIDSAIVGPGDGFFVVFPMDDKVAQYGVNPGGDLTASALGDADTADDPVAVTVVSNPINEDEFAYVACRNGDAINQYSVPEMGGTITPLMTPSVAAPANSRPIDLVADPGGNHLYVATENAATILQYSIGMDGSLSPLAPASVTTAGNPGSVEITSDGSFVVVTLTSEREIQFFEVGADGTLSSVAVSSTRANPTSVALAPVALPLQVSSTNAYVAYLGDGSVGQFSVNVDPGTDSGGFTALAPAAVSANPGTIAVDMHPDQDYLVTANSIGGIAGNVTDFTRTPASGLLTAQAPPSGIFSLPLDIVVESTGRFAYVLESGASGIRPVVIDKTMSPLAYLAQAAISMDSRAFAMSPNGTLIYSVSNGMSRIDGYEIETMDGTLSATANSPYATEMNPRDIVVHPNGRFVYTANNSGSVSMLAVAPATGELNPLTPAMIATPMSSEPVALAARSDGRNLYVSYEGLDQIGRFTIDPDTGLLTAAGVVDTGTDPGPLSIDASGQLLTVSLGSANQVQHFLLDDSGIATPAGTQTLGGVAPRGIVFSREVQ